jgi:hypothetical protein
VDVRRAPLTCMTSRWVIPVPLMGEPGGHTDVDRSNAADPPTLGTSILPVASSCRMSMGYTTPPLRPANVLVTSRNVVQSSGRYRITNQSCVLGVTRLGHPQGDNRRAWTRGYWSAQLRLG